MPLFFLGTREWRNRQTRTVQVRVPVMEWGFNSPLAHDETADPLRICGFCFPWLLLVAPLVFRAPEAPAAVCAGGRRPAREPSALRASLGASPRSPARPRRRPPAPRQIPPAPFTPAALCRWSVAGCVGSKPGQAPPLPINFARNSPAACSIIEFASLELQCFWGVSKNDHDKLRAKFGRRRRLVADMWLGASPRSLARPRASKRSLSSVSHAIP